MLPFGERAENACSISLLSLRQDYLVAMATSLDKLENKVQIHHLHMKRFHMVKRLQKSVQYIRRYLTKYAEPRREHTTQQFPSIILFSTKTTGPNFSKILHNIVASCICKALVYSISERHRNEWRWSILTLPKCSKINWLHSNVPCAITKLFVSFVIPIHVTTYAKRLTKIGLVVAD